MSKNECCLQTLNFHPVQVWPLYWPVFAWDKKVISGFSSVQTSVVNFEPDEIDFLSLFHSCYPRLNLLELGRIIHHCPPSFFPKKQFLSFYGFHQDEVFIGKQLRLLLSAPVALQKWVIEKEVHLGELRILASMESVEDLHFIYEWLLKKNVSHALGVRALELAGELMLMGFSTTEILKPTDNLRVEEVILAMESLRKPVNSKQDSQKQKALQNILWPVNTSVSWKRKGDAAGVEMKLWCQSQVDLERQLKEIGNIPIFDRLNKKKNNATI